MGQEQQGDAPLAGFSRLLEGLPEQTDHVVNWSVTGETNALGQRFMVLQAQVDVTLECQRCLSMFDYPLQTENRLQLVETEAEIEAEEAGEDDPDTPDHLLGSSFFDVLTLVEDELILALPYVPKHEVCPSLPQELETSEGSDTGRPSPFAVLAELKKD
ncbi:MAG: hypothetical protein GX772_13745 [Alcaligenaceae bacterium]|nr:hypothetical protein [Alcaligenaceae bacterium]